MSEPINKADAYVSRQTRWVAVVAATLTGVFGLFGSGYLSLTLPISLMAGALVSPYSPREGRRLIRVCAFPLSVSFLPWAYFTLRGIGPALRSYHDFNFIGMVSLSLAAPLAVVWCDVSLVLDVLRRGRAKVISRQACEDRPEWLSWIAAAVLSYSYLPGSVRGAASYGRIGRLDILVASAAVGAVIVAYDVLVVIAAINMFGSRSKEAR